MISNGLFCYLIFMYYDKNITSQPHLSTFYTISYMIIYKKLVNIKHYVQSLLEKENTSKI